MFSLERSRESRFVGQSNLGGGTVSDICKKIARSAQDKIHDGKRTTQIERMCLLLSDGRWHSSEELANACGLRFGASVHRLRHELGITVEVDGTGPGVHNYRVI